MHAFDFRRPSFHTRTARVRSGLAWVAVLLLALAGPASADVPINARTTECSGEIGFATFDVDRLFKIQAGWCPDPDNPGRMLQQVLLISTNSITDYEVLSVTEADAQRIYEQVSAVSEAKLENLTRPDIVVEHTGTTQVVPAPTSSTRGEVTPPPAPQPTAPPVVELLDPRLNDTRSLTNVIMTPNTEQRLVVGRVRGTPGIMSVTVNGQEQELDVQGMFKTEVATREARTPVSVVAVDTQGQSSSVEFRLVRESPSEVPAPAEGEDGDVFGRYHAIVIANTEYENLDDLATPENDGAAIADILREQYGFEVTTLYNGTRYDMLTALNELRASLTENDNLLIYFAGHGAYDGANNRGHWLPVDAEQDSTANWISTIDITDLVNAMSARHVLVVADSCYSGALSRSENTALDPGMSDDLRMRWLQTIAKTRSRHLLTSGGVKPIVDDGGNGHSIFANALINVLRSGSGIMESSVLYRDIKERVVTRAEELQVDQSPQYAELKRTGHEYGEFVLIARQ